MSLSSSKSSSMVSCGIENQIHTSYQEPPDATWPFSPPLSLLLPYLSHYSHIHPASALLGSFFTVGLSDRNLPVCLNVSFHLGPVSPWRKPPFSFLMWVSCYQYFRVKWSEGGQGSLPVVGMNLYLTSALSGAPWFRSSQALLLWRVHMQSFWGRWRGQ